MTQYKKENFLSGIEDKVVVITGASSGIGEATALLLAERCAKVVLGARQADRLEALAARISNVGGEVAPEYDPERTGGCHEDHPMRAERSTICLNQLFSAL